MPYQTLECSRERQVAPVHMIQRQIQHDLKVVTDPEISQFSGNGADFQAKNQLQSDIEEIHVLLQIDKLFEHQ